MRIENKIVSTNKKLKKYVKRKNEKIFLKVFVSKNNTFFHF